jgi:hypothetical protein
MSSMTAAAATHCQCRYAAGKLYVAGLFEEVAPVNFITIATPHLGSFK